jgi:hypothetical protein
MTSAGPLQEFRVTFGLEYSYKLHPTYAPAHPDGWLTIEAPDEVEARRVAVRLLGVHWSGIYPAEQDDPMWLLFPQGEVRRIPWGQVALPEEKTDEELQAEDHELFDGDPDRDFDTLQDMLREEQDQ